MRDYQWITFDCYGTLIDWQTGISSAFERVLSEAGVEFDRDRILELYAIYEPQEQRKYRPYKEILRRVAARICDDLEVDIAERDFLPLSLPSWQPFSDTNAALERLASRYRLGILSNVDRDLLSATLKHLKVSFDLIVTAEDVGGYKPGVGHFQSAKNRIDEEKWIHAAQSYFHDLVPCHDLRIDSAWINRLHETAEDRAVVPLFNGPDLAAFANWMLNS